MTQLVACLSTGKGTWGHVNRLIEDGKWDSVILLTNEYGKENFSKNEKTELVPVNLEQGIKELTLEIQEKLRPLLKGAEVALNLVSGTGKEHMAIVSSLIKLGFSFRLIALTKDGIEEI